MTTSSTNTTTQRPIILVLEGLSKGATCCKREGADVLEARPHSLTDAVEKIDSHLWDGVLLTGGGDVDPRMYGQRPRKEVYGVSENRDLVETYALCVARERGVPVMGICRGHQIINVEAGGTLKQDIPGHQGIPHKVLSVNGTAFREWAGLDPRVISLHHQRVEQLAPGYEVTARASDGTVEAIESLDGRVMGVQFHPEMDDSEEYAQNLFRWLVCNSAQRAHLPNPGRRVQTYPPKTTYTPSRYVGVPTGKSSGVTTTWQCPSCALRFDKLKDRDDHVTAVHGGMVTQAPTQAELDAIAAAKRGNVRHATNTNYGLAGANGKTTPGTDLVPVTTDKGEEVQA